MMSGSEYIFTARGAPPPLARAAPLEDSLGSRGPQALVCHELQVVNVGAELGEREDAGRTLPVANQIHFVDRPDSRLRFTGRPRFAARPDRAVRLVLNAQLQVVPRVGLP